MMWRENPCWVVWHKCISIISTSPAKLRWITLIVALVTHSTKGIDLRIKDFSFSGNSSIFTFLSLMQMGLFTASLWCKLCKHSSPRYDWTFFCCFTVCILHMLSTLSWACSTSTELSWSSYIHVFDYFGTVVFFSSSSWISLSVSWQLVTSYLIWYYKSKCFTLEIWRVSNCFEDESFNKFKPSNLFLRPTMYEITKSQRSKEVLHYLGYSYCENLDADQILIKNISFVCKYCKGRLTVDYLSTLSTSTAKYINFRVTSEHSCEPQLQSQSR